MNPLEKLHKISPETITDGTLKKMHSRAMDFYDERDKLSPAELDMYEGIYQQVIDHIKEREALALSEAERAEEQKKQQQAHELKNLPLPHVAALDQFRGNVPQDFKNRDKGINLLFLQLLKDPENEDKKTRLTRDSQKLSQDITKHFKTMAEEKKRKEDETASAQAQAAAAEKKKQDDAAAQAEADRIAEEKRLTDEQAAEKQKQDDIATAEAKRQEEANEKEKKRKEAQAQAARAKQEHDEDPVNVFLGDDD